MCREVWGFESLRGHQNRKGRLTKVSRPFVFWGPRARRLRALREGRESPALQGRTGSRDVTESLRGHQNKKGRLMKINRPFAFGANALAPSNLSQIPGILRARPAPVTRRLTPSHLVSRGRIKLKASANYQSPNQYGLHRGRLTCIPTRGLTGPPQPSKDQSEQTRLGCRIPDFNRIDTGECSVGRNNQRPAESQDSITHQVGGTANTA